MGVVGFLIVLIVAVAIGGGLKLYGGSRSREEWGMTTLAAFLGGFAASELFGTVSEWGPAVDGLYLVPALVGAVLLASLASYGQRTTRTSAV